MKYVHFPSRSKRVLEWGGKCRGLVALAGAGLPVPPWFGLAPEAFMDCIGDAALKAMQKSRDTAQIEAALAQLKLTPSIARELNSALDELCPNGEYVAVRSSAVDEDSAQHSFAGQLESFLFVHPTEVALKIVEVWRSAFNERVLAYRREHRLGPLPAPPAVIVQRMLDPEVAGVAFGADPVSGRRGVSVVSAVHGLATILVSGESDADTFLVDREGHILDRRIAEKHFAHRFNPESATRTLTLRVPAGSARVPALVDDQIREIARMVRLAGRQFGRPQDIEWAVERDRIWLLQSRPITSIKGLNDPDAVLNIWDNSNIAESYGGTTTPLTFSFARRAYEEVYRQFCRLMRVPREALEANDHVFRSMLGYIQGRVYYNLLNWHRVLALLPGFKVNRRFMEQMMGVREGLPEVLLDSLKTQGARERFRDGCRLALTTCGLVLNHFTLPSRIRNFQRRLNRALQTPNPPIEDARPDEIAAHYHSLEGQLLSRWDGPIVNDFFAMIFYGFLRRLTGRWCADESGSLPNDLLCGEGGIISAEPARRLGALAAIAAPHPGLVQQLTVGDRFAIEQEIRKLPSIETGCREYLRLFGDRCIDELKLESATLNEDPLPFYRSLGQFARRLSSQSNPEPPFSQTGARAEAEARVHQALKRHPIRRGLLHWVLRNARERIRNRENLRFERTRVFGRVRQLFLALGRQFHERGLLQSERDIFFLEVNEVLGFINGTVTSVNLKALALLRRAEFERHEKLPPPSERFETRGMVHHGNVFKMAAPRIVAPQEEERSGMGCSPGFVGGPVRIVRDPRTASLDPGEILVAERTDPGWILVFPSAAGLIVERGSMLSHSAIVARELGIPAVVSIPGLTQWLKDGDWVEMDGSTGQVNRVIPAT